MPEGLRGVGFGYIYRRKASLLEPDLQTFPSPRQEDSG